MEKVGLFLALGLLAGCAQVGPVLPPSVGLPRPVTDLQGLRSGDAVELTWTPPRTTSDGVAWKGVPEYNLCVWPGAVTPPPVAAAPVAVAPVVGLLNQPPQPQIPSPPPRGAGSLRIPTGAVMPGCPRLQRVTGGGGHATIAAAQLGAPGGLATLALYAVNSHDEGAGWSNPVVIALTPVSAAPRLEAATATAEGVEVRWQGAPVPPERVRIYRDGERVGEAAGGATQFLDTSIAWNHHYQYWVRSVAGTGAETAESADSNHAAADTTDVFPPPVPTGLQALPGPAGVDLSWEAVTAFDLRGYNVYRQAEGTSGWEKRNAAPLPTPVYHDAVPAGGASARYAVTSVDETGNESARSEAAQVLQR